MKAIVRRIAFTAALLLGAIGLAVAVLALVTRSLLAPAAPGASPVVFDVSAGATLSSVANRLEAAGLVKDARAFVALARFRGLESRLQAGEYDLSAALPAGEILAKLTDGRVRTFEVLLPEGLNAGEIATRLAAAGLCDKDAFLAVVRDPASAAAFGVEGPGLEGYLFPETYRLPRGLAPREIARTLVEQFRDAWQGVAEAAAASGLSMRQVVTLASIVEKETGVGGERPLVASVFRNRLARGMRLESDPTVIYGIADFDGNLKRVHLEDESNPYNTYRIAALPPGPIGSPGADALRAVVAPAATDYLFFVSRNDGTHVFSKSFDEHVNNVNRFQRSGQRRAGP